MIHFSVGDTKNHKPSNMFGPKKTPSQSPYMRLLNRALSKSETNGDHGNYQIKYFFIT